MRSALLVLALCVVAANGAVISYNQVSFCQRYAKALFFGANATTESALIQAVVTRAATGAAAGGGVLNAVVGLFNSPLQQKYFNGTAPGPNGLTYIGNSANTGALVAVLTQFFGLAMGCREMAAYTPSNMNAIHAPMMINKAVFNDFVGNVAGSLTSFGVPSTGADITYASNLLMQFAGGSPSAICTQADCPAYMAFGEFTSGTVDGTLSWISSSDSATAVTQSLTIAKGGNVHWNIGSVHNVVQTDATWTALTTGFTSGAGAGATATFNWNVGTTDATYYFVCAFHSTSMRGKIIVGNGGLSGSGAASVSASVTVAALAVAAALALRL